MTAEEFKLLKSRVKAEMNRRCLAGLDQAATPTVFGSLRKYGDPSYDFTEVPIVGSQIKVEHGAKTLDILLAVKDINEPKLVVQGDILPSTASISNATTALSQMENESIEGSSSSCRGACSGLCYGSCIGACNGCTGTCTTGCQGCTASCGTGCASGSMT